MRTRFVGFLICVAPHLAGAINSSGLNWENKVVEFVVPAGVKSTNITFRFHNPTDRTIQIRSIRPSCGCTVLEQPRQNWPIAPAETNSFTIKSDLTGRSGLFAKTIGILTDRGRETLQVRLTLPSQSSAAGKRSMQERTRNLVSAINNRQAVFEGKCVECHVKPGVGKHGRELYDASCGICHEAQPRAGMVPDLRQPRGPREEGFWRKWVEEGRAGTLMPAFAERHGGPLTEAQIESLLLFVRHEFKPKPE